MTALNVAYGEEEKRGLIGYYACALLLAAGLLLFGVLSLALVAAIPAIVDLLPVGTLGRTLVGWLRWPVLAVLASVAIAAIYHYAPSHSARRWRWVNWGAMAAAALWIAGSALDVYETEPLPANSPLRDPEIEDRCRCAISVVPAECSWSASTLSRLIRGVASDWRETARREGWHAALRYHVANHPRYQRLLHYRQRCHD